MKLRLLSSLLALLALPDAALASDTMSDIARFYAHGQQSLVLLKMGATVTARPTCATDPEWDYAISTETVELTGGSTSKAALISAALTAKTTGATVRIVGTGTCTLGPYEDIYFLYVV